MQRQRIDKWLWHARVVRTRAAAAALAYSGHVRVNGQRVLAASRPVHPGDVVTVALDCRVRVMRVVGFGEHRGCAAAARALYAELATCEAPPQLVPPPVQREQGAGRPSKRERRAIDRLRAKS